MIPDNIKYHTDTWTGANSSTTDTSDMLKIRIHWVAVHYDASIINNCTITLDSGTGSNYDTVIHTFDNGAGVTDNFQEFTNLVLNDTDELQVACDVGVNNAYLTVCYEGL